MTGLLLTITQIGQKVKMAVNEVISCDCDNTLLQIYTDHGFCQQTLVDVIYDL